MNYCNGVLLMNNMWCRVLFLQFIFHKCKDFCTFVTLWQRLKHMHILYMRTSFFNIVLVNVCCKAAWNRNRNKLEKIRTGLVGLIQSSSSQASWGHIYHNYLPEWNSETLRGAFLCKHKVATDLMNVIRILCIWCMVRNSHRLEKTIHTDLWLTSIIMYMNKSKLRTMMWGSIMELPCSDIFSMNQLLYLSRHHPCMMACTADITAGIYLLLSF